MGASILLFSGVVTATPASEAGLAKELLLASDRARGSLAKGLSWDSEVESREDGEVTTRRFRVRAKGDDALVEAVAPARNVGEIYLFNDRNMWFFKPSLRKPVAISARQKLTGQAANGDIASSQYARDYEPKLEKQDVLNGQKVYVLLLKAKSTNVTYDQIRYWIREKDRLGIQAEFLTLQGQPFKRAQFEYNNQVKTADGSFAFVSEMKITDASFQENVSTIRYQNPKSEDHPDRIFRVGNLSR